MFTVLTEYPVAVDSLDHRYPFGAVRDNHRNAALVAELVAARVGSLLDLGCAGGGFVDDLVRADVAAVGLEGSDEPRKRGLGAWPHLDGKHLFTCDITRPFEILSAPFDVITAWDVLEHISVRQLAGVLRNVAQHLRLGGLFIGTSRKEVSGPPGGPDYHVTKMEVSEWNHAVESRGPFRAVPYPYQSKLRRDDSFALAYERV